MNLFTAPEVIKNYAAAGKKKTELSVFRMLVLGILAGMFIALGAAVTNTAAHTITDVSTARIICGLFVSGRFIAGYPDGRGTVHWELPHQHLGSGKRDDNRNDA